MRVPLSWLAEYVDLAPGTTPDDVLAALVRVGFEEEDVHRFDVTGPLVVGEVLAFDEEPQSNGKTIRWCQVDVGSSAGPSTGSGTGERDVRGIVCGARNFFPGDKVVVSLPGSVLPGPFPISARKTYGHVSDGMIASAKELGLGEEHSGILRLVELGLDAEPGEDAIPLLGLDDAAIEVSVTPDRGYALSLRGIAREYSHATGATFRDPGIRVPDEVHPGSGFPLAVDDTAPLRGRPGATEFVVRIVRDVDPTRPTPSGMVARLALAGIRSLGVLVDVTNYVMLELGAPIHGYDLDRLSGGITVRRARSGEALTTLDGQRRTLDVEDLLITDESGPIGLAGVMGGGSTEMSTRTRNVLIEAAVFDTVSIARTARRHKLPSEASRRFERGVDPGIPFVAAQRVADLLARFAGGTIDTEVGGALFASFDQPPIQLPRGFVGGLIGVDYRAEQIVGALETIGCELSETADGWRVVPPSWRPDLTDRWTLAEEVARIEGYDAIPSVLPTPPSGRGLTAAQRGRRRVANALAAAGFVETPVFPFTTEPATRTFEAGDPPAMRLANPLAGQSPFLRRSLLPGLLATAHRNLSRGLVDLALFEIGVVFRPAAGVEYGTTFVPPLAVRPDAATLAVLDASLPPQPRHVAVLVTGATTPKQAGAAAVASGLSDVLDAVRTAAAAAGVHVDVAQAERPGLHPGRTGVLAVGGVEVGVVGEVLAEVSTSFDLPGRVTVAELDLDAVLDLAGDRVVAAALATLPAATQDVSLVVLAETPAAAVAAALAEGAGDLLEAVRLVDDYRGEGVAPGSKSVTFALRFRASGRTLTAAEATDAKLAGVAVAADRFGARIRD